MATLRQICSRLAGLFRRRRLEAEMAEEMQQHLERRTQEKHAEGLTSQEARYAAQREFGGVAQVQEQCRDERRFIWLEQIAQDIRFALRMLGKNPGFTVVALLTLALGIGANTAIFSVVHAVLLRGLPYRDPEHVVQLLATGKNSRGGSTSAPDFGDWRSGARSFEGIAATTTRSYNLTGQGEPERLTGARASANYFDLLGVTPVVGRTFTAEEDLSGGNKVALISHGLWQSRFAGSLNVVGQTMLLDREPHTIVGVLPAEFALQATNPQVWTPLALTAGEMAQPGNRRFSVTARLRSGVTREQAEAEMQTIARQIEGARPGSNEGWSVRLVPIRDQITGPVRRPLFILLGSVGLVLLIACANVANLLLARGEARQSEMAVRAALGAGRGRIARQLLTESLLLAIAGSALGLVLASLGIDRLVGMLPAAVPRLGQVGIDGPVLAFTLLVALLTGVLFGVAPSLRAAKIDLNDALKRGGRTSCASAGRLRRGLVVAEVALALVLLIGAGLLGLSFWRIQAVDTGLRREPLLALQLALPESRYPDSARVTAFYETLLSRLRALPDAQSVGLTSHVPLDSGGFRIGVTILGRPPVSPQQSPAARYRAVSANYFATLGVPVVAGRGLDERDRRGGVRVAVINQTMAQRYWTKENPIGQRFTLDDNDPTPAEIVGVVTDVKHFGPVAENQPEFFMPFAQASDFLLSRGLNVVVQPRGDIAYALATVRSTLRSLDPELPLYRVTTLQQLHRESVAMPRVYGALLGSFALAALLLAAIGIYGVIAYTVAQRQREIGVRIALGASRRDVLNLVVGDGVRLAVLGAGLGLLGALGLTRLIAAQLYNVSATDPEVFIGVTAVLIAIALLACWLPARRAAKLDPMVALRTE